MRAFLLLAAALSFAACRASDDSAGTTNPDVATPAEMPPEAAEPAAPDAPDLEPADAEATTSPIDSADVQ